ncbi:KRAB-A domain-containing protein 2-like [Oopsacas minuta]|uniref:KRAB-A domain-containing protein 2-like n=1 Tax=Oopsacas minuta TaxID=111878 RepID=A0AAV7JQN9_9METZ|nr:KRAB-A domain-containing protein 2-like [Oopsacas minuta]
MVISSKETNEWASEFEFVQYSKNNAYHSGIKATPSSVHFGRTPPDLSVDMLLPSEILDTLDDEYQLEQALATRQVTEYAHAPHTPPTRPVATALYHHRFLSVNRGKNVLTSPNWLRNLAPHNFYR